MKKYFLIVSSIVLAVVFLSSCPASNSKGNQSQKGNKNRSEIPESEQVINSAEIEVSGGAFGTVPINIGKTLNITVLNYASVPILDLRLEGLSASFKGAGTISNCRDVKPGGSCAFTMELLPQILAKPINENAQLRYRLGNNNEYSKNFSLSGQIRDIETLFTSNLNFVDEVQVGTTESKTLSLRNPSNFDVMEIDDINTPLGPAKFSIDWRKCAKILPLTSCNIDVKFKPDSAVAIKNDFTIDYRIAGLSRKESFSVTARGKEPVSYLGVSGNIFGNTVVEYGEEGTLKIRIKNDPDNKASLTNLRLLEPALSTADFKVNPVSSCFGKVIDTINPECSFRLLSKKRISATQAVNANLDLGFDINGVTKTITFSVNGSFNIKPLEVFNQAFGTIHVIQGNSAAITITVSNPSIGNSSIKAANDFKLYGNLFGNFDIESDVTKSTCFDPAIKLKRGQNCNIVLSTKNIVSLAGINYPLTIRYKDEKNTSLALPFNLAGNINVVPVAPPSSIEIKNNVFGPINVNYGNSFEIAIAVTNKAITAISDLKLKFLDNTGSVAKWPNNEVVRKSNTTVSTCGAAPLASGSTCIFALTVTPNPLNALTNYANQYRLIFKDAANAPKNHDFPVSGSWTSIIPPNTNHAPPKLLDSKQPSDPYFSFSKREVMTDPKDIKNYPLWVWNLLDIAGKTFSNMWTKVEKYVPWTFQEAATVKLKDIVPDRIVDPTTGVRYVKLFHGTTSNIKPIFAIGANKIDFSIGGGALGKGFYLTASSNEAASYACDRRAERLASDPTIDAATFKDIILVVGLEENDIVKGMEGNNLSDSKGNPTNPNIYFRRNQFMPNQFAFFTNVKPFIKIFEIITFDSGHARTTGYSEDNSNDGYSTNSNVPDNKIIYKCLY